MYQYSFLVNEMDIRIVGTVGKQIPPDGTCRMAGSELGVGLSIRLPTGIWKPIRL